jgi:hypothetical protein
MSSGKSSHIDIGILFESARINAGLDEAAKSHAASCELCRNRIDWMRAATELGPHEVEYEPPKAALDHVLRFGRSPQYLKKLRNFIVASLTFDSFNSPAPVGVRSTANASHEQTYETNEFEVSLSSRPSEDRKFTLMGQVVGKHNDKIEDSDAYVDLISDGDHVAKSTLSSWGEFIFPDVDAAQYRLQVHIGDLVIWIPQIQVGRG